MQIQNIKEKFKEFKFCKISNTALRTYEKYHREKLKAMHMVKTKKRDLGLANIDSYVMMEQLRRIDTD